MSNLERESFLLGPHLFLQFFDFTFLCLQLFFVLKLNYLQLLSSLFRLLSMVLSIYLQRFEIFIKYSNPGLTIAELKVNLHFLVFKVFVLLLAASKYLVYSIFNATFFLK